MNTVSDISGLHCEWFTAGQAICIAQIVISLLKGIATKTKAMKANALPFPQVMLGRHRPHLYHQRTAVGGKHDGSLLYMQHPNQCSIDLGKHWPRTKKQA